MDRPNRGFRVELRGLETGRPARRLDRAKLGRLLHPVATLVLMGTAWRLVVPLSSLTIAGGGHPLGFSTTVSAIQAIAFAILALAHHRRIQPSIRDLGFFLVWAIVSLSGQTLLFWAARQISASAISVIVVLDGFIVFAVMSLLRFEAPSLRQPTAISR